MVPQGTILATGVRLPWHASVAPDPKLTPGLNDAILCATNQRSSAGGVLGYVCHVACRECG